MENLSLGEKRLRINFKDIKPGSVSFLKRHTAQIINVLEDFKNDPRNTIDPETARLISTAQTHFENAVMWGVKAVTDGTEYEKELVSFGQYLLSKERADRLIRIEGTEMYNKKYGEVYHADIENWKAQK